LFLVFVKCLLFRHALKVHVSVRFYYPVGLLKGIMTKEKLIEIIQGVLQSDCDLGFLLQLEESELETLAACIRDRIENPVKS
jgi:hypothetical protein